jgi:hypothetical protein
MSKKISDPSNYFFSLDVPEVRGFNANFVYNFFKKNESVEFVSESDEEKGIFPYNIPRYVELKWTTTSKKPNDYVLQLLEESNLVLNQETYESEKLFDKIVSEDLLNSFIPSNVSFKNSIRNFSTELGNIHVNFDLFSGVFNYSFGQELIKNNFIIPLVKSPIKEIDKTISDSPLEEGPIQDVIKENQIDLIKDVIKNLGSNSGVNDTLTPDDINFTDFTDVLKKIGFDSIIPSTIDIGKTLEGIQNNINNIIQNNINLTQNIGQNSNIGQTANPGFGVNLNNINNFTSNITNVGNSFNNIQQNNINSINQSQASLFSFIPTNPQAPPLFPTPGAPPKPIIPPVFPGPSLAPPNTGGSSNNQNTNEIAVEILKSKGDFNSIEEDDVFLKDIADLLKNKILLIIDDIIEDSISNSFIIGFEIYKFENDQLIDRFFLTNDTIKANNLSGRQVKRFIDTKVKYGQNLSYKVRTISIVEMRVKNESDSFSTIIFLAGSQFSSLKTIQAIENIPPEPPQDFRQFWDSESKNLLLSWSFANNKQRDIKKVEILRRQSIYEPYQIIKIFDFDDSMVKYTNREFFNQYDIILRSELQLPNDLKTISFNNEPVLRYIDRNFNIDSKFIYALRSVDAHGLSSDYSIQIMVEYDKNEKKLKKTLISKTGAPRDYPNLFINDGKAETPLDFKVVSQSKNFEIFFDLDMFNLFRKDGLERINVVGPKDYFEMNIINIDNKQTKQIKLDINNIIDNA